MTTEEILNKIKCLSIEKTIVENGIKILESPKTSLGVFASDNNDKYPEDFYYGIGFLSIDGNKNKVIKKLFDITKKSMIQKYKEYVHTIDVQIVQFKNELI